MLDPTLCLPDARKSCFACCPPIRPAGYEHLTYRNILKRILRENTRGFDRLARDLRPITGYSCWALGYLDEECRLVGCLLHPGRNDGSDLRFRVDYEDKCRRETCPEAKTFSLLTPPERRFWLGLAEGLDSFSYSSRRENPLFSLLGWGAPLLGMIARDEADLPAPGASFLESHPFFSADLVPKANAYLLRRIVVPDKIRSLRDEGFRNRVVSLSKEISVVYGRPAGTTPEGSPSHRLDLEQDFLDLLRLHLRYPRIHLGQALSLKREVDQRIDAFRSTM